MITGGLYSALHLHGKFLFTGMLGGLIKMWELATPGRPLRVLEGHEERVTCFSSSNDTLAGILLDGRCGSRGRGRPVGRASPVRRDDDDEKDDHDDDDRKLGIVRPCKEPTRPTHYP